MLMNILYFVNSYFFGYIPELYDLILIISEDSDTQPLFKGNGIINQLARSFKTGVIQLFN